MRYLSPWLLAAALVACGTSDTSDVPDDAGADTTVADTGAVDTSQPDTAVPEDTAPIEDTSVPMDTSVGPDADPVPTVCESARPCGGDAMGNYRFGTACPILMPSTISSCADAYQAFVATYEGDFNLSFDGTYELSVGVVMLNQDWLGADCVDRAECAERGGTFDGEYCQITRDTFEDTTFQSGRWDMGGTLLHFEPDDDEPYDMGYCVTDTGLTLLSTDDEDVQSVIFLDRMR